MTPFVSWSGCQPQDLQLTLFHFLSVFVILKLLNKNLHDFIYCVCACTIRYECLAAKMPAAIGNLFALQAHAASDDYFCYNFTI